MFLTVLCLDRSVSQTVVTVISLSKNVMQRWDEIYHRLVSLMSHAVKIFVKIVHRRNLQKMWSSACSELLRSEKMFIDYEKAFDDLQQYYKLMQLCTVWVSALDPSSPDKICQIEGGYCLQFYSICILKRFFRMLWKTWKWQWKLMECGLTKFAMLTIQPWSLITFTTCNNWWGNKVV